MLPGRSWYKLTNYNFNYLYFGIANRFLKVKAPPIEILYLYFFKSVFSNLAGGPSQGHQAHPLLALPLPALSDDLCAALRAALGARRTAPTPPLPPEPRQPRRAPQPTLSKSRQRPDARAARPARRGGDADERAAARPHGTTRASPGRCPTKVRADTMAQRCAFGALALSPFVSKSGASSTFCLKKWRLLHLFVSKSGVSSTFFSANLKVSGCEAEEGVEKGGEGGIEDGVAPEDVERRTQQILEPSADRSAR